MYLIVFRKIQHQISGIFTQHLFGVILFPVVVVRECLFITVTVKEELSVCIFEKSRVYKLHNLEVILLSFVVR